MGILATLLALFLLGPGAAFARPVSGAGAASSARPHARSTARRSAPSSRTARRLQHGTRGPRGIRIQRTQGFRAAAEVRR